MFREIDIENWKRKETFEHFRDYDNPFFSITANLDVTNLHRFCKEKGLSFALASLFYSLKTANEISEFRLRLIGEKLIEFDRIHATQTILNDDETFSFCYFELKENFFEFVEAGKNSIEKYRSLKTFDVEADRQDLIYYSVIPWISFTSFKNAIKLDENQTIPRLVFGKFFDSGDRKFLPHSVEVHHSLMDGFHVGKYWTTLQEHFDNLD
jgi:chloramphenicol O-acetyltransferase type A